MYLKKIRYENKKVSIKVNSINTTLGLATKHKDWHYEKEVRLISYNPNIKSNYQNIEIDKDSTIEAIYFGCRCTDNDIQTIRNICKERYNGIRFYKMEYDSSDIYHLKATII